MGWRVVNTERTQSLWCQFEFTGYHKLSEAITFFCLCCKPKITCVCTCHTWHMHMFSCHLNICPGWWVTQVHLVAIMFSLDYFTQLHLPRRFQSCLVISWLTRLRDWTKMPGDIKRTENGLKKDSFNFGADPDKGTDTGILI